MITTSAPARQSRGFFEIGVYQPSKSQNVGTLLRSAYQLGAAGVFVIGPRFERQCSDTCQTHRHIPLRQYATWEQFKAAQPHATPIVAVESPEYGGRWLSRFAHPERAVYLLGNESKGLPSEIVRDCQQVVSIESLRQPSYNVAVAGSLVMYHRLASRSR